MLSFKDFIQQEMFVYDDRGSNKDVVVAFRGHLWFFDHFDDAVIHEIWRTVRQEHPNIKNRITVDDADSLKDWLEMIPDAIFGNIKGKTLYLNKTLISPVTSPLIKKVVNALKIKEIKYSNIQDYGNGDSEENYYTYNKKQLLGDFPKTFFHGTTSKYLPNILRFGLYPNQSPSNWSRQKIFHPERVFLASTFQDASYHASNAAHLNQGRPIIIEFGIPDPVKVEPDFDVDSFSQGKKTYQHNYDSDNIASVNSNKLTKHTGLIAYKGRIPANFIKSIHMRANGKWQKLRLDWLKSKIFNYDSDWKEMYPLKPASNL